MTSTLTFFMSTFWLNSGGNLVCRSNFASTLNAMPIEWRRFKEAGEMPLDRLVDKVGAQMRDTDTAKKKLSLNGHNSTFPNWDHEVGLREIRGKRLLPVFCNLTTYLFVPSPITHHVSSYCCYDFLLLDSSQVLTMPNIISAISILSIMQYVHSAPRCCEA